MSRTACNSIGFDPLHQTGDGEIVLGLLDLQRAFFHEQPQAVHFRFGNALGKAVDGVDRSGQFGLGDLDRFLAEADVDVVGGVGLGDQQIGLRAFDGDTRLGIVDLADEQALFHALAFANVEPFQHARFAGRQVDLLNDRQERVGHFDRPGRGGDAAE